MDAELPEPFDLRSNGVFGLVLFGFLFWVVLQPNFHLFFCLSLLFRFQQFGDLGLVSGCLGIPLSLRNAVPLVDFGEILFYALPREVHGCEQGGSFRIVMLTGFSQPLGGSLEISRDFLSKLEH